VAKRGPRTDAGRRASSLNALTHGALARTPVIPGVEDEAASTRHLDGFRQSLAPANPFEDFLVERIANTAWRLKRLERYENEMLALAQLNAEREAAGRILFPHGGAVSLQGTTAAALVAERIARLYRLVDLIHRLKAHGPASAGISRDDLDLLYDGLHLALSRRGPSSDGLQRQVVEELTDDTASRGADFAENLAALLEDSGVLLRDPDAPETDPAGAPGQAQPSTEPSVLRLISSYPAELVLVSLRPEILRLEHAAPDLEAMISRIRSEGLLLDPAHLAAVTRYEAHLRRQFVQYLHELQAMQSQRAGLPAPLARLDVQLSAP
jgi:hypothetical protein